MKKILKGIKNFVSPGYWAEKIGNKFGLYSKAKNSSLRKWVNSLQGWKWWVWQLGVGTIFFILIEILLNMIGMTIIPWK